MAIVTSGAQYIGLEEIDAACTQAAARVITPDPGLLLALRSELISVTANGLRRSALGQGMFGPHTPRPGLLLLAGPGGVGKSYVAELLARVLYGERFHEHFIHINCRTYLSGRFPLLSRPKLETGPLAVIALDGVEALLGAPPIAALWSDVILLGRTMVPVEVTSSGQIGQAEASFERCLIVATANVAREQAGHIGFRAPNAEWVGAEDSSRLVRSALQELFEGDLADVFPVERWVILPPLDHDDFGRLLTLRLAMLEELLPRGSPPIELAPDAAMALVDQALEVPTPNKTAALVRLIDGLVEPAVNAALVKAGAPLALQVQLDLGSNRRPVACVSVLGR